MNYIKVTCYGAGIILLLYFLNVTVVVDGINNFKDTWNFFVDYVLTFRYHQPVLFMLLPLFAFWALGRK